MSDERVTFQHESAFRHAAEQLFLCEQARITAQLPFAQIEHIGSTAIPGALTKGDLDILVRVRIEHFPTAESTLATMFARNEGSDRSGTFASFKDDDATPPLGVQLCAAGGPQDDFILLRDLLRVAPSLLAEYNALKQAHADHSMTAYRAAKSAWIENILTRHKPGEFSPKQVRDATDHR